MIPYEKETITSLYVNTQKGCILFLGIGTTGRQAAKTIKNYQSKKRRTSLIASENLKYFYVDTKDFDVKATVVLTDYAEPMFHKKFKEIAQECKELNIVSMLFFAFDAEDVSKYPANDEGVRIIDGIQLETIIQLSARHFNFTHCDYIYKEFSRSDSNITPFKALASDGNVIVSMLATNDKAYFLADNALEQHDYWWDIN